MAGTWRFFLGVGLALLFVAGSAQSFGGRFSFGRGPTSYYYAPPVTVPSYGFVPYCLPSPQVLPVPDARATIPFARPSPAPPSSTGEPPLNQKSKMPPARSSGEPRMPIIVTSHTLGGSFVPGSRPLAKNRCRVGFWNLAGRDVTVVIDGKAWQLAKDRSMTMDLERQFAWQIEGQPLHVERLPETALSHEVVIRE